MAKPRFLRRNGATVDDALIEAFRGAFRGQVILPTDAGYDAARRTKYDPTNFFSINQNIKPAI